MASKRQRANGVWEYQFERKGLLPRTYRTFDTEDEGDTYALQIDMLLDKGIVPVELMSAKFKTISDLLSTYSVSEALSPSSEALVPTLCNTIGDVRVHRIGNAWLDTWVETMQKTLAPTTLKKRVELLARAVDWGIRKELLPLNKNPMRFLPRGYAGRVVRGESWDGQRDRRLRADGTEERAIRKVLLGKEEHLLFDMALESAMRLREMYTLTRDQVDIEKETIFLDKTKNGDKRQVPMTSVLKKLLVDYLPTVEDRLFSWWDGTLTTVYLDNLSSKLSQRFARRFEKAGCPDLHFHDLRHCSISRIYERTTLTDVEVAKISGHKDPRMLSRYANIRGSTLAKKLW